MSTWQEIADLFYGEQAEEGMNAFMAQAGQLSALPQAASVNRSQPAPGFRNCGQCGT